MGLSCAFVKCLPASVDSTHEVSLAATSFQPLLRNNRECLQALLKIPWGAKLSLIEVHCLSVRDSLKVEVHIFDVGVASAGQSQGPAVLP